MRPSLFLVAVSLAIQGLVLYLIGGHRGKLRIVVQKLLRWFVVKICFCGLFIQQQSFRPINYVSRSWQRSIRVTPLALLTHKSGIIRHGCITTGLHSGLISINIGSLSELSVWILMITAVRTLVPQSLIEITYAVIFGAHNIASTSRVPRRRLTIKYHSRL